MSKSHSYPNKQPRALFIFFGTELWERYGFYTVQTLLALYLVGPYHLTDTLTYTLMGSFTALTYISPLLGGWIADNLLGQKNTVMAGAVVLLLSYFSLGLSHSLFGLTLALSGISVGTGLFKPNISSMLGFQYKANDPRRDSGFTLFYVGISLGIILGTLLPSTLKLYFGWHVAFFSAGIGLIIGLIYFYLGCKKWSIPDNNMGQTFHLGLWGLAFLICIILFTIGAIIFQHPLIGNYFFIAMMLLTVGFVLWDILAEKGKQRFKTLAFLLLCLISTTFWMLYFQMFLSLTLFISRLVQPNLFGIAFPAPYYVTFESIGLVILGPILAKLWLYFSRKNKPISTPTKFSLAMTFTTLALGIIYFATYQSSLSSQFIPVSIFTLLIAYGIISIAELCLSPVGLSMVTKLIPAEKVSVMMGVFFVSLGIGAKAAGWIADFASVPKHMTDQQTILIHYLSAFKLFILISIGTTILAWILTPIIRKLIVLK